LGVLERSEEEPDPDEEPEAAPTGQTGPPTPVVAPPGREYEYRSELLSQDEIADGTLVTTLNESAAEGWDLVEVIAAGEKRVVLLRRPKRGERESRPVGFQRPHL
jgi:hypothetical protein